MILIGCLIVIVLAACCLCGMSLQDTKEDMRANPHFNKNRGGRGGRRGRRGRKRGRRRGWYPHHRYDYFPHGHYNSTMYPYTGLGGYPYGNEYYDFGGRCRTIEYTDNWGRLRSELICVPRPAPSPLLYW